MVEVFKTNVQHPADAELIVQQLLELFPGSHINFDLDDCDKILRVQGNNIYAGAIIYFLQTQGYEGEALV